MSSKSVWSTQPVSDYTRARKWMKPFCLSPKCVLNWASTQQLLCGLVVSSCHAATNTFLFGESNLFCMLFGKTHNRRTSVLPIHLKSIVLAEAPWQEKPLYFHYMWIPIETQSIQCKAAAKFTRCFEAMVLYRQLFNRSGLASKCWLCASCCNSVVGNVRLVNWSLSCWS